MKLETFYIAAIMSIGLASCGTRTASRQSAPLKDASARKAEIEIVVPASAVDTNASERAGLPTPPDQGNYQGSPRSLSQSQTPKGLPSLFPARQMRRITVVRYLPGWSNQTPAAVRAKLFELTRRELEPPSGSIIWSEMQKWTIEAQIEFSEGPPVRMLTDGNHTCLVEETAQPWFFRISPEEYICGFGSNYPVRPAYEPSCKLRGLGIYRHDPAR